jgi:hypothetical protein
MSDPFKEFVEEMSRLAVPEDEPGAPRARRVRVGNAHRRARRVQHRRECRRRVPMLGGAGALGADPQGAGAGRTNLTTTARIHASGALNCITVVFSQRQGDQKRQEVVDVEAVAKHDASANAPQCTIILPAGAISY